MSSIPFFFIVIARLDRAIQQPPPEVSREHRGDWMPAFAGMTWLV
jgi:hypothetical protein